MTLGLYHKLTYHIVFSTRYRRHAITKEIQPNLYEYIGGTIRSLDGHLIEIGGAADHVHILANLSPVKAVSDTIRDIKSHASKWVNESQFTPERFEWQKGYGEFTVSQSQIDVVRIYIQHQEEHHLKNSFDEEYIAFLKRHGIEFNEGYLFEAEHHG